MVNLLRRDMVNLIGARTQVVKIEHRSSNAMAEDGLWQIKNDFYTGWGKDCAKAIEVLHAFRY